MEPIVKCCKKGNRIRIIDDKLRACMYPKPKPSENGHIVYDLGVQMIGGIKFCPFCGKKIEVKKDWWKENRKNELKERKEVK